MVFEWRVSVLVVALAMALPCSAGPVSLDGLLIAGHDAVDPAVRRFTGKVTAIGQPGRGDRVSTLRFEPLGPGMVAPQPGELRGWRITFIKGKLFGQSLWVEGNTPNELTVRETDPSLAGVVEGDILMIELLDPTLMDPSSRRDDDDATRPHRA